MAYLKPCKYKDDDLIKCFGFSYKDDLCKPHYIDRLEQELAKFREENEKLKSHLDKAESLIEPMTGESEIPYSNKEINARIWIADKEELFGKKCTSCNINKAVNWNEYGDHLCSKCDETLGE